MRKAGVLIGRVLLAAVVTAGVIRAFAQGAIQVGPITTATCTDSTTGCRPGVGSAQQVTAFTNCKNTTSTKDLFIPTKISQEWTAFLNWAANHTNIVTLAPCGCPVNACTAWGSCSAVCGSGTQTCIASATPQCIGTTQSCTGNTPVNATCSSSPGCSPDTGFLVCYFSAYTPAQCGGAEWHVPCCLPNGDSCALAPCCGNCVMGICQ